MNTITNGLLVLGAVSLLALGNVAKAADTELDVKSTTDTSKNPITGTVTETRKYKKNRKLKDGTESHRNVKETTKTQTDGTVEKKVETETADTERQ